MSLEVSNLKKNTSLHEISLIAVADPRGGMGGPCLPPLSDGQKINISAELLFFE